MSDESQGKRHETPPQAGARPPRLMMPLRQPPAMETRSSGSAQRQEIIDLRDQRACAMAAEWKTCARARPVRQRCEDLRVSGSAA